MPHFDSEYEQKLYADRVAKLDRIAEIGARLGLSRAESLYPNAFRFTHTVPELLALGASKAAEELEAEPIQAAVAGRLMSHRAQGKAGFAHLQQGGERLQIYARKDDIGTDPDQSEALFALYKLLDLGDHIGVRGTLMRTRTGELTLKLQPIGLPGQAGKPALEFLAKAMLALPDKYHGLEDVELRYRQRYVDLIMNSGTLQKQELPTPEPGASPVTDAAAPNNQHADAPRNVREVFVKRAAILRAIRRFFDQRGYLEVETPMMHTVAGGAAARPFRTHHNALDIPLSLRIAPELFLKRLVVGGMDRVYEINRNFRNEGVSTQHNPEFTMLEFYQAYSNYHDLMDLTVELISQVAKEVNGTTVTHFNGHEIDLAAANWTKLSMREAIVRWWPQSYGPAPNVAELLDRERFPSMLSSILKQVTAGLTGAMAKAKTDFEAVEAIEDLSDRTEQRKARFDEWKAIEKTRRAHLLGAPFGKGIADLFEVIAERHLVQPTIIYDFPLDVSPLAKKHVTSYEKVKPGEPEWVERFEFYIGGFEVGNAFSELNDAADQEARFEAQVADKDPESMSEVDHDYVRALGYGLPPTAGEGIGIDRLTMLLTGSRSIRDVILFPLLRPQAKPGDPNPEDDDHTHGESAE